MRNIPLHATPKQPPRPARAAAAHIGASWHSGHTGEPARSSRPLWSRLALVAGCTAAGILLAGAARALLPTLYEADSRIVLAPDITEPPPDAAALSDSLVMTAVTDLRLDQDADFNREPRQPPVALLQARSWIEDRTGWVLPPLASPRPDLATRFRQRVDVVPLGRSSRVLEVRARSADPRQAAAIANEVARLIPRGTLVAPALVPANPAFPSDPLLLLGGGGAGMLIGLAGLARSTARPRRFSRPEDVETASGLPVIAAVPDLDDAAGALAQVLRDPGAPYADSLRKLYEKLHSERWPQTPKVIAVSSALAGEGRSTLAASLGRLLASEGTRVLLIDCDWRHPVLHRLFRLSNETGLTSLLVDPHVTLDDVIQTDALSGLDIITAGRRNRTAVMKLISDPMRRVLSSLAGGYDLVLLDIPPVLAAEETLLLSCVVDKLIFAIRWRHTPQRKAIDAMEKILAARGDVVGVVFARVDMSRYRKTQGSSR